MLRVKPLDTLFTAYDEPFVVDIESDRDTTIDIYVYGEDTPFTSISVTAPYTRAQVWSTNPIAGTPTNQAHKIIFKDRYTGEQVDIWIAYFRPRIERVELRPARGLNLMGYVTQMMILGDLVFIRRVGLRRFALIDVADHSKVFHEFVGFNESNEKFYYVDRQDRILSALGGETDLYVTLNPVKEVPVTVEYEVAALAPIIDVLLPALARDSTIVRGFITALGGATNYILRFYIGVARLISKFLGIQQEILDVRVEGGRLKVTYLIDAPPLGVLVIIGLGIIVGAFTLMRLASTVRDIVADVTRTIQTVEIMNAIQITAQERTRAIQEALNYAQTNNLTPQETYELIEKIAEQYTTGDIVKATTALQEADKWRNEAEAKSRERYLWALGGAGVGAVLASVVRRG
jgi:hypothetical protein